MTFEQPARQATRPHWLARLSVEDGLYAILATAAGVLRLSELGRIPLSPAEAQEALAAWGFWRPDHAVMTGVEAGSPAYFSLAALLSQLLGSGDAVMRLAPALLGVALVLAPRLLRHRLGPVGALVASLLLALSPILTATARTAGGGSLALLAVLLFFAGLLRLQEAWLAGQDGRRWLVLVAGALALGLGSAPVFYSGLLTLVLAWLAQSLFGPPLLAGAEGNGGAFVWWPGRVAWRRAALWGVALFLAVNTLFLWHPGGLGAAARLLADWLRAFSLSGDVVAWLSPLLALARYETAGVVLGAAAVLWATWRGDAVPTFLVYWLIGGLALILLQRGEMANAALATLPTCLLIGAFVERHVALAVGWPGWLLATALVVLGLVAQIHLVHFLRVTTIIPDERGNLWFALVVVAFAVTSLNYVRSYNRPVAQTAGLLALLFLFGLFQWGGAWWLSHTAANDTRERWVTTATDNEAPLLASLLRQASRQMANSDRDLSILTTVDSPVLRWYLRDFARLTLAHMVPRDTEVGAIITPQGAELAVGREYTGSDFGLTRPETPHLLATAEALRWWLLRQSSQPMAEERVLLWLRTDMVRR